MSDEHDNHTRSGLARYLSLGLVILIVGVGIVLAASGVFSRGSSSPAASGTASSKAPASPTAAVSPASSATDQSVCGLKSVEMTGSLGRAPSATWTLVGSMAAPSSAAAGPGLVTSSSLRRCYARTPSGAVFAAANITAMLTKPELMAKMARDMVVPGAGRDAAMAKNLGADPTPQPVMQIAGFQLVAYDGNTAMVNIAFKSMEGDLFSEPWQLQWTGGDWKFAVATSGSLLYDPVVLKDLSGYVAWGSA